MSVPHSVADVLRDHVTLEVESIDRMYLNVFVPQLQMDFGVASFFRNHRGHRFASSALMNPVSQAFIGSIEAFAKDHGIPLFSFEKGERKDDVAARHYAKFKDQQGVLFVGKAQEKAKVFRTEKRRNPTTGCPYPWIVPSSAMVNQFYFYCVDENFGRFFLKFCSYFPYNAKLCLNGHEYAMRQLRKKGIAFEGLDNGFLSCADPKRLQQICDGLTGEKIDALLRKWLRLLPHPFTGDDCRAGYRYDISILQAEFALTQILDRPVTGRMFFEEVIRENLDLGRPDQVQLIFDRRVIKTTPGRFRTRVITNGVIPSLHVDYKHSRIKQYFKEGQGLRTETTINDTRDFGIGKRLKNLPALRQLGFQANRRLLDVQRISHDCTIGEKVFDEISRPIEVNGQRVSALRLDDTKVQALFTLLVLFALLPLGFTNRDLRERFAQLLGLDPSHMTRGRMTYQLRRLRLRGVIERIKKTNRYRLTQMGLRIALFYTRVHARLLRPALSRLMVTRSPVQSTRRSSLDRLERDFQEFIREVKLAS